MIDIILSAIFLCDKKASALLNTLQNQINIHFSLK